MRFPPVFSTSILTIRQFVSTTCSPARSLYFVFHPYSRNDYTSDNNGILNFKETALLTRKKGDYFMNDDQDSLPLSRISILSSQKKLKKKIE